MSTIIGNSGDDSVKPDGGAATADGHTLLFYNRLEPLEPLLHGDLALVGGTKTFEFARPTNSVPLNAIEFISAARHYPILFNGDERGMPLALVGLRAHENLFVEENGHWAEGCYIPAFIRRYPFVLTNPRKAAEIALCVDPDAPLIESGGERLLFKDGVPTKVLQSVAQFCASYAREQNRTRGLVAALRDTGVLIDRSVDIALRDGEKVAMRGFKVVDEAKFQALPDDIVLEWWHNGWMGALRAHMVSLGNFGRLHVRAGGAAAES